MSTHNICFRGEIRKIYTGYPPLSRPMVDARRKLKLSCGGIISVFISSGVLELETF